VSTLDDFAGRLRGLVISVSQDLEPTEAGLLMHLIDHDEGGEALISLGWFIVEKDRTVTRDAIATLRKLAESLGVQNELPAELDRHTR
jgi:hypothetical protein